MYVTKLQQQMLWSIKTKNSQIINFNHDQLINNTSKQSPQTSSQSLHHKKIQSKKSFQDLIHSLNHYIPISKYVDMKYLQSSPYLQIKKYRQCIYYGQIINNQKQGKGIMLYTNSRFYQGDWKDNYKSGKGYQKFTNSSIYYGSYLKGKPHGYGKYQWQNGQIYQGEWQNGLKNGSGIWRGSQGDSYIGEWKDGKANGYGVHTWINGNRYQGEFNQCLKHGEGIQKFANGDLYKGKYKHGKPHGYGEYNWNDGSSYKGDFNNGLRNGKGLWRKGQGNSDTYEGQFVDQKKQGYGVFIWANGSRYTGNFKNDLRQGYGEMYWIDGNVFKGEWHNGQQASQNQYCPQEEIDLKTKRNSVEEIFQQYNPQLFPQFQEFDEPSHPEIVQLKKYRARDITRIKKIKNQQSNSIIKSNIPSGFLLSKNFVTEAVAGNKNPKNLSKRPSRLSIKEDYYNSSSKQKIKHCQSTSSRKNMSSSICNYLYVNKPYAMRNDMSGREYKQQMSNTRSRNNFTPKQRMIKSSAGIRNVVKNKDSFIQDMTFNRFAILNHEQEQLQNKIFSRSKNKSQIF